MKTLHESKKTIFENKKIKKIAEEMNFSTIISDYNLLLKKIVQSIIFFAYLFLIYAISDEIVRSINLFPFEFMCHNLSAESCKTQIIENIICIIFILPWIYWLVKDWHKNISWLFIFVHIFYFVFNIFVLEDIENATMVIIPELKSVVCYHGIN